MLSIAPNSSFVELPVDVLHEAVACIWNSMLDLDVQRDDHPAVAGPESEALLAGQVAIQGGWRGRMFLVCPKAIARKAAAAMFNIPLPTVTETELRDTLGELTHMLGGNLKSLLPAPSQVSLPIVTEHYNAPISGRPAGRASLRCEGQPLHISLFEQECEQHENFDR